MPPLLVVGRGMYSSLPTYALILGNLAVSVVCLCKVINFWCK